LCAVPLLWGLHHNAVRNDRGISALMANPWVHWRFTTVEWKAVADLAWKDTGKPVFQWKKNWGTGLTLAVSGTGAAWIFGGGMGETVGALVFFLLFPLGVNWLVSNSANEQYRRWIAAPPQAWFGPDGLLIGDEYIPWVSSGKYLLAATIQQGPPTCLVFRFRIFTGRRADVDKLVPLPTGCDPDLQLLERQLRAVCTNARVELVSA
jgi:hypothetical protein